MQYGAVFVHMRVRRCFDTGCRGDFLLRRALQLDVLLSLLARADPFDRRCDAGTRHLPDDPCVRRGSADIEAAKTGRAVVSGAKCGRAGDCGSEIVKTDTEWKSIGGPTYKALSVFVAVHGAAARHCGIDRGREIRVPE